MKSCWRRTGWRRHEVFQKFFSGNYATVSARPTLIIEYYLP